MEHADIPGRQEHIRLYANFPAYRTSEVKEKPGAALTEARISMLPSVHSGSPGPPASYFNLTLMRRDAFVIADRHGRWILPLERCGPQRCSYRGRCTAAPPHAPAGSTGSGRWPAFWEGKPLEEPMVGKCHCYYGASGSECQVDEPSACYNGCSGHGSCVLARCHCRDGWWGLDCSREAARPRHFGRQLTGGGMLQYRNTSALAEGGSPPSRLSNRTREAEGTGSTPTPSLPGRPRFAIYIYELPPSLTLRHEVDRWPGYKGHYPNYTAYQLFLARLLADWSIRTEDPEEATLFYVPAMAYGE